MDESYRKLIDEFLRQQRPEHASMKRLADAFAQVSSLNRSVLEQISHSLNFGAAGRIAELFAEREREFSALKILTPVFSTRFGGLGKLVIDDLSERLGEVWLERCNADVLSDTTRVALEAAGKALHDRFRYPELEELHRTNSQIAAAISELQPTTNLARIVEALGSIRGPWIDSLSSQASIASFANLTSKGNTL